MKCHLCIALYISVMCFSLLHGQNQSTLSGWGINAQFAGSTGFLNVGCVKRMAKEKIELGLMYGHTPKKYGGPLHSCSAKFLYSPWQIKVGRNMLLEPVQPGVFLCQHFGKNFDVFWPRSQYPRGYYWWPRSLRSHVFLSSSISVATGFAIFQRFSVYFEANSNDLYLASFVDNKNHRSLSLYDIIFFGLGIKLYR